MSADHLIACAVSPATSAGCTFPPPPATFDATFDFGSFGSATIHVVTAWQPQYASLFWQLVQLKYYDDTPLYRVDFRNTSTSWVVQYGYNLQPGVQAAWLSHRAISQAVPASVANTRGRVAFSMDATVCHASAPIDPCATYRPACTATDYCAFGGAWAMRFHVPSGRLQWPHHGLVVEACHTRHPLDPAAAHGDARACRQQRGAPSVLDSTSRMRLTEASTGAGRVASEANKAN